MIQLRESSYAGNYKISDMQFGISNRCSGSYLGCRNGTDGESNHVSMTYECIEAEIVNESAQVKERLGSDVSKLDVDYKIEKAKTERKNTWGVSKRRSVLLK
ncbi:hypothetical protein F8M41_018587 [Gigaspora margarita]|uniref:Uncharacterized protein n=1 Tax=Gigaspora margarita TaxID=4874 RepID=A0A8H4EL76_GIGMA|nr:hypothetical protein F8M41_018587 [Gigaspora margarita]